MKIKNNAFAIALLTGTMLVALSPDANAFTLAASAGGSAIFGTKVDQFHDSSPTFLASAEAMFDLAEFYHLGAFYDFNWLTTPGDISGPQHFFGVVFRATIIPTFGWFADARLGLATESVGNVGSFAPNGTNLKMGIGVGAGYAFPIAPTLSISPRIGYRLIPYSVVDVDTYFTQSFDGVVMASFSL